MINILVVYICHNMDSYTTIKERNIFPEPFIIFVGNNPINEEIKDDPQVIIAKDLNNNIEHENKLLTFTAWYAIVKNNLFLEADYIVILEWDVGLQSMYYEKLLQSLMSVELSLDTIGLHLCDRAGFFCDVNMKVMKYYFEIKGVTYNTGQNWFSTTNHCLSRKTMVEFVDWYYPSCLEIKKIQYNNFSWYHERLFFVFLKSMNKNIVYLENIVTPHLQAGSHMGIINTNSPNYFLTDSLISTYIENPSCLFISNFIDYFSTFQELLSVKLFTEGCGSYLFDGEHYSYCEGMYKKQKLLYDVCKKSSKMLIVDGSYMGHVPFIALLANPFLHITCIESCENNLKYIEKLREVFQSSTIVYQKNNQRNELIIKESFDLYYFNLSDGDESKMYYLNDGETASFIVDGFQQCREKVNQFIKEKTVLERQEPDSTNIYFKIKL